MIENITYCQRVLDEISYPLLNPISYYSDDEDYRKNFKNDRLNYKNYENMLNKNIDSLTELCFSENLKIFKLDKKTIYLQINYIDTKKQKELINDLSDELTKQVRDFRI